MRPVSVHDEFLTMVLAARARYARAEGSTDGAVLVLGTAAAVRARRASENALKSIGKYAQAYRVAYGPWPVKGSQLFDLPVRLDESVAPDFVMVRAVSDERGE